MAKKPPKSIKFGLDENGVPRHLSKNAVIVWQEITPDLKRLNFFRDSDQMGLARYCEHAAKWLELTHDIEDGGIWKTTDSDHVKMERLRPAFMARERIENRLEKLEDRYGLNPAYRQQILQRMAGLVPEVPGELFNKPNEPDAQPSTPSESEPPSAIGLLRPNTIN